MILISSFYCIHGWIHEWLGKIGRNMDGVTDENYDNAKRDCQDFEIKGLREYHDLYAQSDAVLLVDVFKNLRNMCLKYFLSAPGLAWQAALKKFKVKLKLLTDIDMLLMVGNGISSGICHVIHHYPGANNRYMKSYDKNKESSYRDVNNLYGWEM